MGRRRGGRPLNKGQHREWQRIIASRGSVSTYLGQASEDMAEEICLRLQKNGEIINSWRISSRSMLDYQGIDRICQTARGFFFLNVKKSAIGVTEFIREREILRESNIVPFFTIYPWMVGLELNQQKRAKTALESILNTATPSFDMLPDDIQQELATPTYPRKQEVKQEPDLTIRELPDFPPLSQSEYFEWLESKLEQFIRGTKYNQVIEVTLSVNIDGAHRKVKGYGKNRKEAKLAAYEELYKQVSAS